VVSKNLGKQGNKVSISLGIKLMRQQSIA